MGVYAIGDIQGCFAELNALLKIIGFKADTDQLWFTGDLVNRGPDSLQVLRFVKQLGDRAVTVLGNHDLHLLAMDARKDLAAGKGLAAGKDRWRDNHTLHQILAAPDREELLDWLRSRPLLYHDRVLGFTLVHAGLPPQWDLTKAQACAHEVETVLRGSDYHGYFAQMYGDEPNHWHDALSGWGRLRLVTNCFTRLRYCDKMGRLEFKHKGPPGSQADGYLPWFQVPGRLSQSMDIVFGHWATLGLISKDGTHALDTGCVWGGCLTALRLDAKRETFIIKC